MKLDSNQNDQVISLWYHDQNYNMGWTITINKGKDSVY